ncbi:hypothetical protein KQR57_10770 [Bacillus inaquosorum]|nr:hypothetical protein [Bacillus inaquosorum]
MPAVLELEGKLDPERLDRAFKELIERHESLRTSFEQDESGEPVRASMTRCRLHYRQQSSANKLNRKPHRVYSAV